MPGAMNRLCIRQHLAALVGTNLLLLKATSCNDLLLGNARFARYSQTEISSSWNGHQGEGKESSRKRIQHI